jgi:ketopantoate reductase
MAGFSKVWVVGAGAIGSVLAGLLHLAGRAQVFLVGQSVHWQAVKDAGLLFNLSPDQAQRLFWPRFRPRRCPPWAERIWSS